MTMNQKLSAARAERMPTLADAMLATVIAPSTATSALTKAALVVFGSFFAGCFSAVKNSSLSGSGHRSNACRFADWYDLRAAPWRHNHGCLSV